MESRTWASDAPGATAGTLQAEARSALQQLRSLINVSYHGAALFSGVDSGQAPLQGWEDVNPLTGLSRMVEPDLRDLTFTVPP